ncbi:MAG: hypothetical protein FWF08_00945 [Oscillospiraceae bacterium]|nr:hypothetical protein [Oscillospiraceae bacterium]
MTRNEKIKEAVDDCIAKMNDEDKKIYREIAEYAVELGYAPKPVKTAQGISDELAFTKNKVKRTLLRMHPNVRDIPFKVRPGQKGQAGLRLAFFATPRYSVPFKEGVKRVIEDFDGKYTGCYGCGRCKGDLEGYTYIYPDGKAVFRCGRELIALPPISADYINEIKAMIKTQDDFWMKQI